MAFALVEVFSSFRPFFPGGRCVVFTIMACWFYVGKVLTSLAFLSEIMGSDMIFNMLAMIVFPLFVILGPVILVFVITGFYFCTSQLSKESSSFK